MHASEPSAVRAGVLLAALAVSLPVDAGGARSKSSAHSGHRGAHHGVAIFNRSIRDLPNGVTIFDRRPPASHTHGGKFDKRTHRKRHHAHAFPHSKPHATSRTKHDDVRGRTAGRDRSHDPGKGRRKHGHSRHAKKKHKRHDEKLIFYGSTVYVQAPEEELYHPEEVDDENCRSLTERGYDLSGRRVLVEWTLCFDEQGEAYVPEDGRRIVARY